VVQAREETQVEVKRELTPPVVELGRPSEVTSEIALTEEEEEEIRALKAINEKAGLKFVTAVTIAMIH
jgi:hypothetical protein